MISILFRGKLRPGLARDPVTKCGLLTLEFARLVGPVEDVTLLTVALHFVNTARRRSLWKRTVIFAGVWKDRMWEETCCIRDKVRCMQLVIQ